MSARGRLHPKTVEDIHLQGEGEMGSWGCGCKRQRDGLWWLCQYHDGFDAALPDPDDPWATPDACLEWLRERGWLTDCGTTEEEAQVLVFGACGDKEPLWFTSPTLHAALIAACRTVEEETWTTTS